MIPHYWNPQQVERLLDSLAALGLRRTRVAALIMWRSGLRVGETVALEWRDIDVTANSLLVRSGKGGRGRTVPLHPDLVWTLRISSGVSKGIDKSVVQSGRDFPYIRVGGGQ